MADLTVCQEPSHPLPSLFFGNCFSLPFSYLITGKFRVSGDFQPLSLRSECIGVTVPNSKKEEGHVTGAGRAGREYTTLGDSSSLLRRQESCAYLASGEAQGVWAVGLDIAISKSNLVQELRCWLRQS